MLNKGQKAKPANFTFGKICWFCFLVGPAAGGEIKMMTVK
jgi:hypothetical protein